MSQCTWADCLNEAVTKERSRDGQIWARLCHQHSTELSDSLDKLAEGVEGEGVPGLLATWVKAQGGARPAAERLAGTAPEPEEE